MTEVEISTKVFNRAYIPYLTNYSRTQIYYGGSSSGKSYFLGERAIFDVMSGGRNYLVFRQVARTIKHSVFAQLVRTINEWGVGTLFAINKSEYTLTCKNGYQIVCVGLDDVEKIKSIVPQVGAWTDIWCEEATEMAYNDVKQLYKRQRGGSPDTPKRLTLSFNPMFKSSWIYTDFFGKIAWADDQTEYHSPELSIIKTTYKDNRFLTDSDRADLENETDTYFYNVYTLGNWGVLGDVIFTNWKVQDLSGMLAQFANRRNGLDFGFASDPAAAVKTHYDSNHKTVYIFGELYERGLTNDVLAQEVKTLIGDDAIVCDSAEPKSIVELQQYGVNAIAAAKGKDSVLFGIQWLQQQTIIVDVNCINARNELTVYQWRKDKDGNSLRQPVDKMNHLIDGTRYAYENESQNYGNTLVDFA
jgi:phage terminase large subunit